MGNTASYTYISAVQNVASGQIGSSTPLSYVIQGFQSQIYINGTDLSSSDKNTLIQTYNRNTNDIKGELRITDSGNSSNYRVFSVIGDITGTAPYFINVLCTESSGTIDSGVDVTVGFTFYQSPTGTDNLTFDLQTNLVYYNN